MYLYCPLYRYMKWNVSLVSCESLLSEAVTLQYHLGISLLAVSLFWGSALQVNS